ncbi:hypothetical protein AMAG_19488 [Allomyces macrogynus ATCC 38327]|uniref:Secreted protein n=1 Tax=Allomyces macrogynus (strain ATCC 38327) TaxID=578462 RepID=A0A0L0SSR6_ALLM3|nr:hypothetical protein AMAG_19488 [Allomyces macrogynus ATCC 38327]|eukprot:KNE65547.1 hypothetical protein AMAG_19488 [Allomyces macrogynus ATCC 38327]
MAAATGPITARTGHRRAWAVLLVRLSGISRGCSASSSGALRRQANKAPALPVRLRASTVLTSTETTNDEAHQRGTNVHPTQWSFDLSCCHCIGGCSCAGGRACAVGNCNANDAVDHGHAAPFGSMSVTTRFGARVARPMLIISAP